MKSFVLSVLMSALISVVSFADTSLPEKGLPPLRGHPRLFLTIEDEAAIKRELPTNPILRNIHNGIIAQADAYLEAPKLVRVLEGKRLLGVSREATSRIAFLAYAYRMTGNENYLRAAERDMLDVCAFSDWNPKHFLDVGEMALAVGVGYDWLFEKLSESTRRTIEKALLEKGIIQWLPDEQKCVEKKRVSAVLQNKFNWNQVCNGGITAAALSVAETYPEYSARILKQTVESNKKTFSVYDPDGVYVEGYVYWEYGTGAEVLLLEALETSCGSDLGLLKYSAAFMESADFICRMYGTSMKPFNYSDCSDNAKFPVPLLWFASKKNDPSLLSPYSVYFASAARGGKDCLSIWSDGKISKDKNIFSRRLPFFVKYLTKIGSSNFPVPASRVWSGRGENPVALIRTAWEQGKGAFLGIKGGKAANPHGHMDAGSFVFDIGGLRWIKDLSILPYFEMEKRGIDLWNSAQNSDRWKLLRYRADTHNILKIRGKIFAVQGYAGLVKTFEKSDMLGAKFDLTPIYGGAVKSASRTAAVKNSAELEIVDEIESADSVEMSEHFCTPAAVKIIDDSTVELSQGGKTLLVKMESAFLHKAQIYKPEKLLESDVELSPTDGNFFSFELAVPANTKAAYTIIMREK